jgi:hypothetical protein
MNDLDDHMGAAYEEAFREHLRRMADLGQLGTGVVAVGPWWREGGQGQIDAVVLARQDRTTTPVLIGESKWARKVNGARLVHGLRTKAQDGLADADSLRYIVCARETITVLPPDAIGITAADIFTL